MLWVSIVESAGTRSGQTLQYNIIIRNTVVNGERTNELEVTGGWLVVALEMWQIRIMGLHDYYYYY